MHAIVALFIGAMTINMYSAKASSDIDDSAVTENAISEGLAIEDDFSSFDSDRRGRLECTASDRGWEEHWGGHRDCRECLRKHGKCVEKCYINEFVATAEGYNHGYRYTEMASGDSRWEAERRAIRRCEMRGDRGRRGRHGRDNNRCRVINVESRKNLYSNRNC